MEIKNKLRVGIYLRLSQEDKDKINKNEVSESIKNQRNILLDYINKNSNFNLIDEYVDEDLSGAGTYRPEFERLIKDCEHKKLDVVLCKSQSRFSRDMEIIEKYLNNKFLEWNIRFIGISDNADTNVLGNKKARQINGLVNEWYLEDVSNNIRSAFNSKMKQGEFISPFAVFGYEISKENNNKLIVDLTASKIVKKIYNLYLTGLGFMGIVKYLNSNNIPSPSLYKYRKGIKLNIVSTKKREDIKWNTSAVKTILTNEIYLGNLIQGKRTTVSYKNHKIIVKPKYEWIKVLNTHEAIIDEETFKKVQIAIKERTKPIKKTNKIHIFSGKVFCLECKSYMRKKNSNKYEYLVCSNHDNCINKTSIRYDEIENIVLEETNKIITKYYDEIFLKELNLKKNKNKFINEIILLQKEKKDIISNLTKTINYLKCLYEDKVNKIINTNQFKELIEEYENEKKLNTERIKKLDNEILYYKEKLNNNFNIFSKYQKITKLNRIIIEEFIDKIYIGKIEKNNKNRIIQIKWNFK